MVRALIDPKDYPLDRIRMPLEEILRRNPQRGHFLQIESVLHLDLAANLIVAHRKVRTDEFWVAGHLPGRPLMPGVMQCETMAQAASVHGNVLLELPEGAFLAGGGLDKVKFRASVPPPADLWIAGRIVKHSKARRSFVWQGQLLFGDGTVVSESEILCVAI